MHLLKCLLVLVLPLTVVAVAKPRSGTSLTEYAKEKRREQVREMEVRAKYPQWFPDKRELAPRASSDSDPCLRRRRSMSKRAAESGDVEQVLTPQEAAMFVVGQGSFISDNGTAYVDHHWPSVQAEGRSSVGNYLHNRLYKGIVNAVGDLLVEVTLPAFMRFMKSESPEKLYHFTPMTAIRIGDIDTIIDELLKHPDMDEIQVGTAHITRKWLEAAQAIRRK